MPLRRGEASIITSLSFSQLDDSLKGRVLACARDCGTETATTWPIDAKQVILNRLGLSKALERSRRFVAEIEPMGFPFLSHNRATYYEEELSFAFYLALADCELAILDNTSDLASKRDTLLHIGGLLAQLRNRKKAQSDLDRNPALAHDLDNPTRYLGLLFIAPKIAEVIKKMTIDKAADAVDYPASLNDGRLYLVWATEMMSNVCALIRSSFYYISFATADAFLGALSLGTGAMGWILYFLRGGVETAFLFEVSDEIQSLGLSDEEKSECFQGKWREKKFLILNDALWGFVNCVCFFILTGSGILGYSGSVLNLALFFFDFGLSLWQLSEAEAQHEAIMLDYDENIRALTRKLVEERYELSKKEFDTGMVGEDQQEKIARMEWRVTALRRDKRKAEREWSYSRKQFKLDAMYSCSIILAFSVYCVPPAAILPFTALILTLIGSMMCFGLGITYANFTTQILISKTGEDSKALEMDYQDCLILFRKAGADDYQKRLIFLDIRRIMASTEYQKQLLQYQRADLVCRMITDLVLPILFLASFVFMPFTFGLSMFVLALIIIIAAKCYVAELAPKDVRDESIPLTLLTQFSSFFTGAKHEEEKGETSLVPEPFPEKKYQAFCEDFIKGASSEALRKYFLPEQIDTKPGDLLGAPYPELQ